MTDATEPGASGPTDAGQSDTGQSAAGQSAARRLRLRTILVIAILAALTLISTTQTWWTLVAQERSIVVAGTVAAPALSALALCGLALAAALAIAGPFFRFILGVLQLLIGFTVVLTTVLTLPSPDDASAELVSKATGISGTASIHALIDSLKLTPWGFVAAGIGALSFLVGVFVLATFRRWPVASRRYSAVRFDNADEQIETDAAAHAVIDWDALSDGQDPTAGRTPPP